MYIHTYIHTSIRTHTHTHTHTNTHTHARTHREFTMSLKLLKRGYQGFNIGLSQLARNDCPWGNPVNRDHVWWLDTASGVLFNGDQRLNEPPAKQRTDGKEQVFEAGDVLSFTLDLGFSDTLEGRWHIKINGQNLTHCDGVQGPVRLAVQLMLLGDGIADESHNASSNTASRKRQQQREERQRLMLKTPIDMGAWQRGHSQKHRTAASGDPEIDSSDEEAGADANESEVSTEDEASSSYVPTYEQQKV